VTNCLPCLGCRTFRRRGWPPVWLPGPPLAVPGRKPSAADPAAVRYEQLPIGDVQEDWGRSWRHRCSSGHEMWKTAQRAKRRMGAFSLRAPSAEAWFARRTPCSKHSEMVPQRVISFVAQGDGREVLRRQHAGASAGPCTSVPVSPVAIAWRRC
jgi:hypothetical protein